MGIRYALFGLTAVLAVGLAGAAAGQTVVTLSPLKDNTLYSENASASNGRGAHLFAGRTNKGDVRRALLVFDVAGALPAGATIQAATLTLRVTKTIAGPVPVALHRLRIDWGEGASDAGGQEGAGGAATPGDATWSHAVLPGMTWRQPGGDFAEGASATTALAGVGAYDFASSRLTADVQDWLDAPQGNFGWILLGGETQNGSAKRLGSRENDQAAPVLTVTYTLATSAEASESGTGLELTGAIPNPFDRQAGIHYMLPRPGHTTLRVFNLLGQQVATLVDGWQEAGPRVATLLDDGLPPGRYLYRLEHAAEVRVGTVVVVR